MPNETLNRESIPRINNIGINNLAQYGYQLNVPDKLDLSSITGKLPVTKIFGKNMNIGNLKSLTNTASIAGAAGTAVSAILGDKSEYSGDKGYISKGMDSAYDTISDAVSVIPGWGQAASGIMKAAGAMNQIMGKLGNSNDGMTTQDAILSSKLFNFGGLNPVSMVANYGGKRSIQLKDRNYQDQLSLIDSNEAYTASANTLQDARSKAGKKYSLFSNGARHGANNLINQADLESDIRLRISDDRDLSMIRSQSQTSINNQGYSNLISGGLNPIAVGKRGMKMKRSRLKNIVNKANSINSFQKGGKPKPKFEDWYKTVPQEKNDTTNYDLEKAYNELPFEELEQFRTIPEKHLDGRFKKPNHMTYSDEGYGWIGSDKIGWTFYPSPRQQQLYPYEKYVEYWNQNEPNSILNYNGKIYKVSPKVFKQGGQMNIIPEAFKQGGAVIPSGSLHAHKNHMELASEGIVTPKGIPVISEENGEIQQQAEIEREEVIFDKQATTDIEKLYKKFNETDKESEKNEIAIKAGKILTDIFINNTEDNTGLIQKIQEKM